MNDATREFLVATAERDFPFEEFVASTETDPKQLLQNSIDEKLATIRVLNESISILTKIKNKTKKPGEKFEIDHLIGQDHRYIQLLSKAISEDRGLINGTGE